MKCPMCSYDLTGLPAEHTCSECGFAYDPHARVIRLGGRGRDHQILAHTAVLIVLACLALRTARLQNEIVWFLALIVACGVPAIYRLSKGAGASRLLAMNRRGFRFDHPSIDGSLRCWSGLGTVEYGWVRGKLCLKDTDGRQILKCSVHRLGGARLARRCAAEIKRLGRIYALEEKERRRC